MEDRLTENPPHSFKVLKNMRILALFPYAPELNPIEHVWDKLREKFFHNRVLTVSARLKINLSPLLIHLRTATAGCVQLWLGTGLLIHYRIKIGTRLLPPEELASLFLLYKRQTLRAE